MTRLLGFQSNRLFGVFTGDVKEEEDEIWAGPRINQNNAYTTGRGASSSNGRIVVGEDY